jgi:hypothetical protein
MGFLSLPVLARPPIVNPSIHLFCCQTSSTRFASRTFSPRSLPRDMRAGCSFPAGGPKGARPLLTLTPASLAHVMPAPVLRDPCDLPPPTFPEKSWSPPLELIGLFSSLSREAHVFS